MEVHHDKHHQAYVDKVNAALEGTEWDGKPIEEVLKNLDTLPDAKRGAVRNNGGGHYNHSLFWESMGPGGGGAPDGDLGAAIDQAFGSFDAFKTKVNDAGANQFGSGWSWLVWDGSGLAVEGSPNQDTPLSSGKTPLLGVDVWEHAYYLKYQNRRPDYLDAWWNAVNWDEGGGTLRGGRSADGRRGRRAGRDGAARLRRPAAASGMTLPNAITLVRIALIPVVMALILADFDGHERWAAGAYIVAAADRQPGRLAGPLAQLDERLRDVPRHAGRQAAGDRRVLRPGRRSARSAPGRRWPSWPASSPSPGCG